MFESSNMLFVTVHGTADALGDLTTTNAVTKTFAGAGMAAGFAVATAVAEGTTAAAPYTDATTDGLADGAFITISQTSHMSTPVWADPGLGIGFHDVRHGCRRFFVWLLIVWAGEFIRSRTFLIKKPTVYLHEFVRALMRTVPCWKSFQPPAASTTSSAAYLRMVSALPSPQRYSMRMFCPTIQPECCRPCANAVRRA